MVRACKNSRYIAVMERPLMCFAHLQWTGAASARQKSERGRLDRVDWNHWREVKLYVLHGWVYCLFCSCSSLSLYTCTSVQAVHTGSAPHHPLLLSTHIPLFSSTGPQSSGGLLPYLRGSYCTLPAMGREGHQLSAEGFSLQGGATTATRPF